MLTIDMDMHNCIVHVLLGKFCLLTPKAFLKVGMGGDTILDGEFNRSLTPNCINYFAYYLPLVSPLLIPSVYGTRSTTCLRLSSSIISTLIT